LMKSACATTGTGHSTSRSVGRYRGRAAAPSRTSASSAAPVAFPEPGFLDRTISRVCSLRPWRSARVILLGRLALYGPGAARLAPAPAEQPRRRHVRRCDDRPAPTRPRRRRIGSSLRRNPVFRCSSRTSIALKFSQMSCSGYRPLRDIFPLRGRRRSW
jgi:hypothetical protein